MSSPTLAGDWNDDDGRVIDSFLEENTDGAKNPPPATKVFDPNLDKPRETTTMPGAEFIIASGVITSGQITTFSDQPVLLLPADPDRLGLYIHVNSLAANKSSPGLGSDILRISHDPGRLRSAMSAAGVTTTQPVDGMLHTGPVYGFAPETNNAGAGGFMQVWIWSITGVTAKLVVREHGTS